MINFGAELKRLRIESGLTQQDLSNATGISRPHITHIENGTKNAKLDKLDLLFKATGHEIKISINRLPSI